jgi:DNA polymerase-3 subunit gamma/tau
VSPGVAWQSLYRRYRPQRFAEVRGQDHITRTLRNEVRDARVTHAYLFSGPRGTGKTSTARILAKALNCESPVDGEPDGTCASCVAIAEGSSLDVHELDAASNNGVDAMRDLVSRAALGTPGRWKVYIVDEVHMLSAPASNALLKTLEEPPRHVVFVLATTDPQKVLPTIRSRAQHFEFRLLPTELLADHLRWVADDAQLGVAPEDLERVARRGHGSARDALSVLDQVVAAGGLEDEADAAGEVVEALCERDAGRALVAIATRVAAGHDAREVTRDVLERLRQLFLATMARALVGLPDDELARVDDQARRLGPAAIVRAMEALGDALVAMRDAPDPRVLLEVAVVRQCRPDADVSNAALLERIERLERAQDSTGAPRVVEPPPPTPPKSTGGRPADGARAALGGVRAAPPRESAPEPALAPEPAPQPEPPTASTESTESPASSASAVSMPSRDELTLAWGDTVLATLPQRPKVRFGAGRFVGVDDTAATFALPNPMHRDRCEECRPEVESALERHFGRRVPLRLVVVDPGTPPEPGPPPVTAGTPDASDDEIDLTDLRDAPDAGVASPLDQVMLAFEGAEVLEE